jgi:hypothetical protein
MVLQVPDIRVENVPLNVKLKMASTGSDSDFHVNP